MTSTEGPRKITPYSLDINSETDIDLRPRFGPQPTAEPTAEPDEDTGAQSGPKESAPESVEPVHPSTLAEVPPPPPPSVPPVPVVVAVNPIEANSKPASSSSRKSGQDKQPA